MSSLNKGCYYNLFCVVVKNNPWRYCVNLQPFRFRGWLLFRFDPHRGTHTEDGSLCPLLQNQTRLNHFPVIQPDTFLRYDMINEK